MAGKSGWGTLLQRGSGEPVVYGTVANVSSIDDLGAETDSLDVSALDSPGAAREKVAGMLDYGQLSCEVNWDPSQPTHDHVTGIEKLQRDRETVPWRVVFTQVTPNIRVSFSGFIQSFKKSIPFDDKMTAALNIEVDGDSTWEVVP